MRRHHKAASRASFVDHRLPDTFGFENEFNRLADRTAAGESFGCVVCCLFNFRNCVAHRDREASAVQQRKVWKVVSDVGNGRVGYSSLSDNLFISRHLQRLFHVNKFHVHFTRSSQQGRTLTARDAARAKTSRVRERETLAVVRVKSLDFNCDLFGLGQQGDATICHGAIDVHEEHLNLRSAFPE